LIGWFLDPFHIRSDQMSMTNTSERQRNIEHGSVVSGVAPRSVRIAAIGDLHVRLEMPAQLVADLEAIDGAVDLLVIAGDITENGRLPEVELAAEVFARISTTKIAVLGNHDRRSMRRVAFRHCLENAGIILLDGDANVFRLPDGQVIGVAGVGGYGGGFWPEEPPDVISARLTKAVGIRARREAERLQHAISVMNGEGIDLRIVVMHYAPTVSTLGDEPRAKYWMLGNSLLGKVIDENRIDLVIHGHAHLGNQNGQTPAGTPVRNVAAHVTGGPVIYDVSPHQMVTAVPLEEVVRQGRKSA
jgi:Icc-related predicted phosphoesterase